MTAYRALWRQELARARALVPSLPATQRALTSACIELEAGDLPAARVAAPAIDDALQRAVIERLIEHRATGDATWAQAFFDAWVDAGKPDLASQAPEGFAFASACDRGEVTAAMTRAERMIYARMTGEDYVAPRAWASEPARLEGTLDEVAIAMAICGVGDAHDALAARVAALAPDSISARLRVFGLRERASLSVEDARELAAIAELPDARSDMPAGVFERLVAVAAKAGSRSPEQVALIAWLNLLGVPRVGFMLALETTDEPARRAAARAFAALGRRMRDARLLIGLGMAGTLLRHAAKALGDDAAEAEAAQIDGDLRAMMTFMQRVGVHRFPLPSLAREHAVAIATDEVGFWRGMMVRCGV